MGTFLKYILIFCDKMQKSSNKRDNLFYFPENG